MINIQFVQKCAVPSVCLRDFYVVRNLTYIKTLVTKRMQSWHMSKHTNGIEDKVQK